MENSGIELAYNPFIKNKGDKIDNYKFINIDVTQEELYNYVTMDGYPICVSKLFGLSEFKKREYEYFISSRVIAVSFENSDLSRYVSYDSILKNEFIQNYASFVYTTHKHEEYHNKFIIFFVLDKKITKQSKYKELATKLMIYLNSDRRFGNSINVVYGNKDCIRKDFIGSVLPLSVLEGISIDKNTPRGVDIEYVNDYDIVDSNTAVLYTDGSYSIKSGTGGYGYVVTYGGNEYRGSGGYKNSSTQRMELMAVKMGLDFIYKNIYHKLNKDIKIVVYTDSKYVRVSINETIPNRMSKRVVTNKPKLPNYSRKNVFEIKQMMQTGKIDRYSKRVKIENLDILKDIKSFHDMLDIKAIWIKGKNGNKYNIECDRLAGESHRNVDHNILTDDSKKHRSILQI